jgi:hypothetical protein
VPRRPEHDLSACGAAAGGVGREIARPQIRLGLDDSAGAHAIPIVVHQVHADEFAGDGQSAAREKGAREFFATGHRARS